VTSRAGRFVPLALAPLLGGCVFAALPVVAGGLVAHDEMSRPKSQKPATSAPARAQTDQTNLAAVADSAPSTKWVATPLRALPAPTTPVATIDRVPTATDMTSWAAFARYAVSRAPPPPPGEARHSAVIDQATIVDLPRREQCGSQPPAVVIDLDPGQEPIKLDDPPAPAPGLAEALASIRNVGVSVLWLTEHPAAEEDRVRRLLRAVELDPDGSDNLLLPRSSDERKQTLRLAAARDWCILAIAGDRRGDFDELFDYLLDSTGPTAIALEPMFDDGWFLAPPPVG
jgi:hypothetical protein